MVGPSTPVAPSFGAGEAQTLIISGSPCRGGRGWHMLAIGIGPGAAFRHSGIPAQGPIGSLARFALQTMEMAVH